VACVMRMAVVVVIVRLAVHFADGPSCPVSREDSVARGSAGGPRWVTALVAGVSGPR
jgi:hypothetical protein